MKYLVMFEKGDTGWGAYVPDLPGCVATGKTREEVGIRIQAAMRSHLEAMRADGDQIPEPSQYAEVDVA
jgi:predicted RNase H-like HicB family nuclease